MILIYLKQILHYATLILLLDLRIIFEKKNWSAGGNKKIQFFFFITLIFVENRVGRKQNG